MIAQQERRRSFLEAIAKEGHERRRLIRAEMERVSREELAQAEREAAQHAAALLQMQERESLDAQNARVAAQRRDCRAALAQARAEIQAEIFAAVRDKLITFTRSADYLPYLQKRLTALHSQMDADDLCLLVREADLPLADTLSEAFGRPLTLLADESIGIGGFRAESKALKRSADATLESALAGQEEWFYANCGLDAGR